MTPARPPAAPALPVSQPAAVAVVGLIGSLLGTAASVFFTPLDTDQPGQMLVPSLIQAGGLLIGSAVAAAHSVRLLFRVEHLYMGGLIYWVLLDTIQARYGLGETTPAGVVGATTAVGVFAAGVWAVLLLPLPPLPAMVRRAAGVPLTPALLFVVTVACFLLGIFHYALTSDFSPDTMIGGLTKNRFNAPWVLYRIESRGAGSWMAFSEQLVNFGYLMPCLVVLTARQAGFLGLQTLAAVGMTLVLMPFLAQGGGRRIVGAAFGAAVLVYLLSAPRLRSRQFAVATGLLLALLVFLEMMAFARGHDQGLSSMFDDSNAFSDGVMLRVDDNFLRLAQITTMFPERYDYLYGRRLLFTLTRPIPRVLWPNKPNDPGFDLSAATGTLGGTSLSASVVAEWFTVLGYVGVFAGGLAYGLMGGMWNHMLLPRMGPSAVLLYAFGLMIFFVGLRSMEDLMFQSYALLGWLGLTSVLLRRMGDRP